MKYPLLTCMSSGKQEVVKSGHDLAYGATGNLCSVISNKTGRMAEGNTGFYPVFW